MQMLGGKPSDQSNSAPPVARTLPDMEDDEPF